MSHHRLARRREGRGPARRRSPRGVPARSIRASVALALLLPQLAGCYQYTPLGAPVAPNGAEVTVRLNERGREALSQRLGEGIRYLGGRTLQGTDSSLVLAVTTVQYLDADAPQGWTGERLELPHDQIVELRQRRISPARTGMLAGLLAAAAVAISMITIATFGGGDPGPNRPPGGDEPQ